MSTPFHIDLQWHEQLFLLQRTKIYALRYYNEQCVQVYEILIKLENTREPFEKLSNDFLLNSFAIC